MEKILIFGRGEYFKNKAQTFLERFQIVGFLDNAVGDEIIDDQYGVPVYHPSKAKELEDYAIYCVATDFLECGNN